MAQNLPDCRTQMAGSTACYLYTSTAGSFRLVTVPAQTSHKTHSRETDPCPHPRRRETIPTPQHAARRQWLPVPLRDPVSRRSTGWWDDDWAAAARFARALAAGVAAGLPVRPAVGPPAGAGVGATCRTKLPGPYRAGISRPSTFCTTSAAAAAAFGGRLGMLRSRDCVIASDSG